MKTSNSGKAGPDRRHGRPGTPRASRGAWPPGILLALLTVGVTTAVLAVHWPVLDAAASSFDDEEAIIRNHLVQNPSWYSVQRFFSEVLHSSVVRGYYRPLTLTSLMLDWAMGGRPDRFRPFHRTSLALHVGSTVLMILLCYQLFGQPAVAAMAGLLFGLHPLTVEPIAWVMERKTLLAAFFALAALSAYVRYARGGRGGWYAAALVLFLLALLAKPTGTPLPVMMLLVSVWPLRRFSRRAVLETVPFFALAGLFAVLTVLCEHFVHPLSLPGRASPLHLPLRLCYLTVFYFVKVLFPVNLSSVYLLPAPLSLRNPVVLAAAVAAAVLVAGVAASARRTRAIWVGTLIFLVGLAPTMGFVGYSWVVASDKYVYFPAVGLVLIVAWVLERVWRAEAGVPAPRGRRAAAVAVVLVAAVALAGGTRRYLTRWQTTDGFFAYMLDLAPNSARLQAAVASDCSDQGDLGGAIRHYTRAIELDPTYLAAYMNRGAASGRLSDFRAVVRDCTSAIALDPTCAPAYVNRAMAHLQMADYGAAWSDVHVCRRLGLPVPPDLLRRLMTASGRTE